jgi:hypothetical protein
MDAVGSLLRAFLGGLHVQISSRSFTRRFVTVELAAALSFVVVLGMSSNSYAVDPHAVSPIVGPVASKATCGTDDRPEGGVQGDAPLADRFAPGIPRAFNCNLDLVGQARGDGAALGMAVTDRCIYYTQQIAPNMPLILQHPGIVVVDAADPKRLKIVNYVDSPAAVGSDQSFAVDQKRKLMITSSDFREKSGRMIPSKSRQTIGIFDVSDCLHPVLKFSGTIPDFYFHSGEFSADGNTFWAGSGPDTALGAVSALDVSDPSHPKVIAQWRPPDPQEKYLHSVTVSDDGNTAYVTVGSINQGLYSKSSQARSWKELNEEPPQGVALLDVSEVRSRKPDAQIKEISHLYWNDVQIPQFVYPMIIGGHKYLWFVDLMGALSTFDVAEAGRTLSAGPMSLKGFADPEASSAVACKTYPTRPPYGYVGIINIDNPEKPARVSGIRLAVDQPKYCALAASEPRLRGYLPMSCDVDNYQDAKMMACAYGESGVRVFDIRDVKYPREIAYYKPPAAGSAVRKGSNFQAYLDKSGTLQGSYHSADLTAGVFFSKDDRQIWFTSIDGGAQIIGFSKELMKRKKDLFARDNSCDGKLRGVHGCGQRAHAAQAAAQ